MARKKKTVKFDKGERVRFCQLDVYRYIVTGVKSIVRGIHDYHADENVLNIHYTNGFVESYNLNEDELQLKQVIKKVNKRLGGDYFVAQ